MTKKVLIGGGSGLVGSRLTDLLMNKGYSVSHLSRSKESKSWVDAIHWDVEKHKLNPKDIEGFDIVINLAGAGIADEPWSDKRKKVIRDSRVNSNLLLRDTLEQLRVKPSFFVSASAIGFYGLQTTNHLFSEDDPAGSDFLAKTCIEWESSADEMTKLGIPTAKVRIGLVLSDEGGALAEMEKPFRWGVGAPLGNGKQGMPWIHIDDLCGIFIHLIENKMTGVYNGVSPNGVNNRHFSREFAEVLNRKMILPAVPGFMIKLMMGDRADLVLKGSLISSRKIQEANYEFEYPVLKEALYDLYDYS
ncbi:MAG: TIGR01777 family protein [Flavobacteriales bacterium]|mgnify:CR=1 FL=1|nr:TIGR01777 family protein [Flavobacteriales bacterium]|tara:strand:- start:2614 stop:3525 length:912 start_codon:yes stop_codon:yes gene_type:complete